MEHRKEGNGVTCPEEGWKWYVIGFESSLYEEEGRAMSLAIWDGPHGELTDIFIDNLWINNDGSTARASSEERILIYQRIQRAVEFLGLKSVVKFE